MKWFAFLGLAALPVVHGVASTDSLQDTDPAQSGYLPNHNISPAIASTFVLNWKMAFGANEKFYAKPLVWTPPGATSEQVIAVSNANIIRILDGLTGALIAQRTLDPPFQSTDTGGCGDIPNTVGITGTPIIDGATNIMYLFSKGYKGGATGSGAINGQYKFYAIQLPGLTDVFPAVIIDGHYADNDHTRYFVGGTVLNRPGLAMVGNTVIGGFGGHCDNFNYTGMLVAVSKSAGVGVTSIMAMEARPGAPSPQQLDITVQGGGKAGIWQSGFGIAADTANNRVFFVTGNGAGGAGDNGKGTPASGKIPISTLQQATVDMGVTSAGVFSQQDYFEPYEYASLDGGDTDFGSSGAALLSPYFSGGGVSQVVVAGGKSGKIYFMDANNLGGFANGGGGSDAVLQTITSKNKLLSGVASYPAEGGYVYYAPTQQGGAGAYLFAYKFNGGGSTKPQFTLAGQSAIQMAGVGAPTVTSLNGQAGSGIVWLTDVNNGLVAYNAVPNGNTLTPITMGSTGRLQKYQRPAFGNARVYTTEQNQIYGIGASGSTTPAITCTPNPVGFGTVVAGATKAVNVQCTVGKSALTMNGCSTNLDVFQCSGVPATVAAGGSFTMSVTLNLTSAAIELTRQANNIDVKPGAVSGSLSLNAPSGNVPIASLSLTGTVSAAGGYIDLSAVQIDFGGLTIGSSSTKTLVVNNDGAGTMTFTGFAYQNAYNSPYINVTTTANPVVVGSAFTATGFPANGATIPAAGSTTITITFKPTSTGSSASILTFWSNGGWQEVMLVGTASACTSSCGTSSTSTSSSISSSSTVSSVVSTSSLVSSSSDSSAPSSTSSSNSAAASSTSSSSSSVPSTTSSSPFSSETTSSTSITSTTSSTSSSSSTIASVSATTTTSSTLSTVTTSSSSTSTATGYAYIGCFEDTGTGHALPLLVRNNSITPELCEALVSSLAAKPTPTVYPYYYVEYHRECYAGSSFGWGTKPVTSLTGAHACTDVCSGSIGAASTGTAKCGGATQFNLYATKSSVPFVVATTQSV